METYRINEIFHSLQGEGFHAGTAALFLRFAGCNLQCNFCDTRHQTFKEMTAEDIVAELRLTAPLTHTVILTGGEPSLQVSPALIATLHQAGYLLHIETNGTHPLPDGIDWITCSPKTPSPVIGNIDELKVVFTDSGESDADHFASVPARHYSLQPCDTGNKDINASLLTRTIDYILSHPQWRLSLQTHKITNIK